MPAFEIKLTMPDLPKTIEAFEAEPALRLTMINEALRSCGKVLTPAIKAETPVGKGEHRGPGRRLSGSTSARIRTEGGDQQLVISQNARTERGVSYGIFVREGTKPHDITPRDAKALHFFIGGREVFALRVHHPGTKPNNYPQRAYDKVAGQVDSIIANINQMTAERLAGSK